MATRPISEESPSTTFSCCGKAGGWGKKKVHEVPQCEDEDYASLAKELNELSVQERERVFEEVHGVAQAQEETQDFVTDCVTQFDKALSELSYAKRKELDRAFFLKPSIQKDWKFKLLFLRADQYNARQAAERMAKYFAHKLTLFGEDKLVKEITLDDLDQNDIEVLHKGANLVLPYTDRSGRPIWFTYSDKYEFGNLDSMMRAFWYVTMATLESDTAQSAGIISVMYIPSNKSSSPSWPSAAQISEFFLKAGSIHLSLPSRITSFHFCAEDSGTQLMLSTIRMAFGKQLRLRVRAHFGSSIEIQYSLGTFGIRCQGLLEDGREKTELVEEYLQRRLNLEKAEDERLVQEEVGTGIIKSPAPNDVLLGRGRPYQNFSGNHRFLELVDVYMERYLKCSSQFETSCLILDVVKSVHDYGGRFLKRTELGWEVVTEKVARTKTGASFRTRNAKVSAESPPSPPISMDVSPLAVSHAKRVKYDPSVLSQFSVS